MTLAVPQSELKAHYTSFQIPGDRVREHDQKLRQPVFLGLRDDKKPEDVTLPEAK